MNNTIYAVIGLVVVAGIAGWFVLGNDGESTGGENETMEEMMQGRSSLRALLALDEPQTCTFTHTGDTEESSGTVYVAHGKMRGDFTAASDAGPTHGHMIVMDNTGYVWTDGMMEGFRISLDDVENTNQDANTNMNIDEEVDYSCEDWREDSRIFDLPQGVEFMDMGEMMNQMMGGMNVDMGAEVEAGTDAGASAEQCAACAQVSEAFRAQCLASLGCS